MTIQIAPYTVERVDDVVEFEKALREEEDFWLWDIDDEYIKKVKNSFSDESFRDSISLLAYSDGKVVGRIDSSMIKSHFDGETRAYLDWICVLKSFRHRGIAQKLLSELIKMLKERKIDSLVAITASNDEAQSFYRSVENSEMRDTGIWIEIK